MLESKQLKTLILYVRKLQNPLLSKQVGSKLIFYWALYFWDSLVLALLCVGCLILCRADDPLSAQSDSHLGCFEAFTITNTCQIATSLRAFYISVKASVMRIPGRGPRYFVITQHSLPQSLPHGCQLPWAARAPWVGAVAYLQAWRVRLPSLSIQLLEWKCGLEKAGRGWDP